MSDKNTDTTKSSPPVKEKPKEKPKEEPKGMCVVRRAVHRNIRVITEIKKNGSTLYKFAFGHLL